MERNRRQFIRGRWLSASSLPSPEGCLEIASILVQARPETLDDVASAIEAVGGTEIHNRDECGKLVVVVEGDGEDPVGEILTRISLLPGVLSATLVFHATDVEEGHSA